MKIYFLASECAPLVKVGGLGDVAGALPKALQKLGEDVTVCLPFYKTIDRVAYKRELIRKELPVEYEGEVHLVDVYKTHIPHSKVSVILFENEAYLSGGGVYFASSAFCESHREIERFSFFSKAVLELIKKQNETVDIIHCNDWHTASVPVLLRTVYKNEPLFKNTACVFTIHNLGNQGVADLSVLGELGIKEHALESLDWDAQNRDINMIMEGAIQSDVINAVSPNYAKEILTKEYGEGMEEVLRGMSGKIYGILNGVDYEVFNPEKDKSLFSPYTIISAKDGKLKNKTKLRSMLHLNQSDKPLIGMVTRITDQKGLDLVEGIFEKMIAMGYQFVLLGLGDEKHEKSFTAFARKHPHDISINLQFSAKLANQIYAASDIFLMPSKFEPCGLGQIIAMRYGSIPLVRSTGGLKDTVEDGVTGYVFKQYSGEALLDALKRALHDYRKPDIWSKMIENAMKKDYSWQHSATEYQALYKEAQRAKHER